MDQEEITREIIKCLNWVMLKYSMSKFVECSYLITEAVLFGKFMPVSAYIGKEEWCNVYGLNVPL